MVRSSSGHSFAATMMTGAASITVPAAIGAEAKTPRPFSGSLRISRRSLGMGRRRSRARALRTAEAATPGLGGAQARSRGRSPTPTEAVEAAVAAGGVTWAGGLPAVSSSGSFMPDLNALMPLAKSPMTLEILPLPPNNSTPTPITSSQCQMLREPIRRPQTLPNVEFRDTLADTAPIFAANRGSPWSRFCATRSYRFHGKSSPQPAGHHSMPYFPPPHPHWERGEPESAGL